MTQNQRDAFTSALAGGALHGLLALALFPRGGQFTKYPWAAAQQLAGQLPPERVVDFSPFYFYLNLVAGALLGRGNQLTAAQNAALVGLQVLATAAATGGMVLLLRRFFARWVSLAGAAAFVLLRGVMVYTAVLEPEPFLQLFLIAFLYFSLGEERRDLLLAGGALALALAVRPTALPLLALVPLYFRLNQQRGAWLRSSALVLTAPVLLLAALTLRNGVVAGSYSPLGMNSGFVFYEGNNPLSHGRSAVYPPVVGELKQEILGHPDNPHLTYRLIAERSSGRALTTAEANRYWRRKGFAFIADHPTRFFERVAEKGYLTLHSFLSHDVAPAQGYDERLRGRRIPAVPFALIAVLAAWGLVASLPRWRRLLLVYATLLNQVAVMLVLYVSERQRLAAVPAFVFFAGAGAAYLAGLAPRRRVLPLVGSAAAALALSVPTDAMRDDRHLWRVYRMSESAWARAVAERDGGSLREAASAAAASYSAAPWLRDSSRPSGLSFPRGFDQEALARTRPDDRDPSRRFDRAQLLLAAGQPDAARATLDELVVEGQSFDRLFIQSSQPAYWLARALAAEGDREGALSRLEQARRAAPGEPFVLAELAALTGDDAYRAEIVRYFSEVDAAFLIGLAQLRNGAGTTAAVSLRETALRVPEFWRPRLYLAAALGAAGDTDDATRVYLAATAGHTDPTMLEERFVPIFAAAVGSAPLDATKRYEYGVVLAQFGRFDEALVALDAAYDLDARPEIQYAMDAVEQMRARLGP